MNNVAKEWSNFNLVSNGRHLVEVPRDPDAEFLAEHRRAYEAAESERQAALDRAARVSARVASFIEAGSPVSQDAESPRGRLTAHTAWLDVARRQAAAATVRLATIDAGMVRRRAAEGSLAELDRSVRTLFAKWVTFGSEGERPDDRVQEREVHRAVLVETEADHEVADSAQFESDVATAVVETLDGMLPGLRHDVLIESATVIGDRIDDIVADLRQCYGAMAALGEITRALPRTFNVKLPHLPVGPVGFEVAAADMPEATAGWRKALADLEQNPGANVTVPVIGFSTVPAAKGRKSSGLHRLLGVGK